MEQHKTNNLEKRAWFLIKTLMGKNGQYGKKIIEYIQKIKDKDRKEPVMDQKPWKLVKHEIYKIYKTEAFLC